MRERPVLFGSAMVRSLLDGRKTQTRRVVKPAPQMVTDRGIQTWEGDAAGLLAQLTKAGKACPHGGRGDRLWVRETHAIYPTHGQHRSDGERWGPWGGLPTTVSEDGKQIAYYREGFDRCDPGRWRPSIHMPRWASRILLEITDVRVERLQEISEDDAVAEGIEGFDQRTPGGDDAQDYWRDYLNPGQRHENFPWIEGDPRASFRSLWESINGPGSWAANPWVWVIGFRRMS
jgi:hypothetical protein